MAESDEQAVKLNSSASGGLSPASLFFDVRSLFYLLTPRETYYEKAEDVPDLTLNASNLFFLFIVIEQVICLLKNGRFAGRFNDSVTSVSAGLVSSFPNFFGRKLHFVAYAWVYDNYRLFELSWDSVWTYLVTFLFVDMMYYWFHRAAHEVNVFWAAHQTHHSSEDYNFTTALRQSIFQGYTSWFFYLPLAFFVRPSIYMVHSHLNLIYQFWIHTEIVDSIGPLEFILNTPSHHRVHHGRNPYCLDKNYAGVLIIWDRIFGTFEAEKKDEEIAYGLVHPLKTFDPLHIQIFNYKYIFKKAWAAKTWSQKFGLLFMGPAWQPGTPRLGNPETVPKIKYPIRKYDGRILSYLSWYVGVQFAFVAVLFAEFAKHVDEYPTWVLSLVVFYSMFNLTCFGWIFDAKPNCLLYEALRCVSLFVCCIFFSDYIRSYLFDSSLVYSLFWLTNFLSFCFVSAMCLFKVSVKRELAKKAE